MPCAPSGRTATERRRVPDPAQQVPQEIQDRDACFFYYKNLAATLRLTLEGDGHNPAAGIYQEPGFLERQ